MTVKFLKVWRLLFRHISYDAEFEIKNNFVKDALKRIGKLDVETEEILDATMLIIIEIKRSIQSQKLTESCLCGFYSKRSHRVVPLLV